MHNMSDAIHLHVVANTLAAREIFFSAICNQPQNPDVKDDN